MRLTDLPHPLAITMWDFSWLERRWPGAGYEDWNQALDELAERGYDAVRIDAYPHLLAADATARWQLLPVWTEHDWGAPGPVTIPGLQSALTEFVAACRDHGILVALSSWYRQDTTDARMRLTTPDAQANAWIAVLDSLAAAGLADHILYVDLGNELPLPLYNPYVYPADSAAPLTESRTTPRMRAWMADAIGAVRAAHPQHDYCFSFASELTDPFAQDVSTFDLLELHLWMTEPQTSDFYRRIGYDLDTSSMDPTAYTVLQGASAEYRRDPGHWQARLQAMIDTAAQWSRDTGKPLATTECWATVTYKDWPGLDWDWVKQLCEFGVRSALKTCRWSLLATSNFCGPQFNGMWRDTAWHQRLTTAIHAGSIETSRHNSNGQSETLAAPPVQPIRPGCH